MVETIRQIRHGTDLARSSSSLCNDLSGLLGVWRAFRAGFGDSLPVKELLRLMIGESDNIAAMIAARPDRLLTT